MAAIKCVDCNPDFVHYPDDAIYLTEDIPAWGIKSGDTLKKLIGVIYKAIPGLVNSGGEVNSGDVFSGAPPNYLTSGYSKYWDKISLQSGWYMVESIGTDRVVSFDFSDVIANLGSDVSLTNITTDLFVTEVVSKKYSSSNKPANSYRIDMNSFPVNMSFKVELKRDDGNVILLTKDISVGNMASDKAMFKFEIKGFDNISVYTQEDVNQVIYAKMANIANYVEDLKARNIIPNLAAMNAKIVKLETDASTEQRFQIGRQLISLTEFISDMYAKMDDLSKRLEKYEKS